MKNFKNISETNFNFGLFLLKDKNYKISKSVFQQIEKQHSIFILGEPLFNYIDFTIFEQHSSVRQLIGANEQSIFDCLRLNPYIIICHKLDIKEYESIFQAIKAGHSVFLLNCNYDINEFNKNLEPEYINSLTSFIIKHRVEDF